MDFAVTANHRLKRKESKKIENFLDLARELKKLCNTNVPVIPVVVGNFQMFLKDLEKSLEKLEIIRSARILR